jgi:hypothetical protein
MAKQKRQKGYPRIRVERKTGGERFSFENKLSDTTLLEFWQWSISDLVNNSTRGILAEYIVAQALGIAKGVREPWKAYDLDYRGMKIEVKSAAYLQTWYHKELSKITFPVRPTRNWDAETNVQSKDEKRRADIYVFCVLEHIDKKTLDPMKLDQWRFYLLRASVLNRRFPKLKSIGLKRLMKLEPYVVRFNEIKDCIDMLTQRIPNHE